MKPRIFKANGAWYLQRADLPMPVCHFTWEAALHSLDISIAARWWE